MNSNEDYLDSLLANAIQQNKESAKPISESLRSESSIPSGSSIKDSVYSAIHEEKALERLLAESTESATPSIRESLNASHQNLSGKKGQAVSDDYKQIKTNDFANLFTEEEYNEVDSQEDIDDNIEELLEAAERDGNRAAKEAGLTGNAAMDKDISELFEEMNEKDASLSDIQNTLQHNESGKFLGILPKETDGIPVHNLDLEETVFPGEDILEEEPKSKKKRKKNKSKKNRKTSKDAENLMLHERTGDQTDDPTNDNEKTKTQKKKEKKGLFAAFQKKKKGEPEQPNDCSHLEFEKDQKMSDVATEGTGQASVDDIMALFQDNSDVSHSSSEKNAAVTDNPDAVKTNAAMAEGHGDIEPAVDALAPTPDGDAPDNVSGSNMDSPDKISTTGMDLPEGNGDETEAIQSPEEKKKKPNFFQKLFATLTEEAEEDNAVPEQNDIILSDENLQVLNELEEPEPKGKKPKKKKEKKPKKAKAVKQKKKKEAPKKEEPGKKIPRKHITGTFVLAASILLVLLLLCMSLPNLLVMKDARDAYYQNDYKEAFLYMYGKKLNDSDQLIYDRSRTIILLDRKLEAYQNYLAIDMPVQALDSLLQGIKRYEVLYVQGEELGITEELDGIKAQILDILQRNYGISEQEAEEIIGYDPLDYTNKLESVINGTPFEKAGDAVRASYALPILQNVTEDSTVQTIPEDGSTPELPDLLPEEQEYLQSGSAEENPENTDANENEATGETDNGQRLPQANAQVGGNDVEVYVDSEAFE
ncbi:MAG: hypothetical protein ACI4DU_03565 [Lachnospiraceae bacterium]